MLDTSTLLNVGYLEHSGITIPNFEWAISITKTYHNWPCKYEWHDIYKIH